MVDFFEDEAPVTKSASTIQKQPAGPQQGQRRWIAIVIGVVILLLIVLGIKGCLSNRKDRAFKNYITEAAELVKESNSMGSDLFELLDNSSSSTPLDLEKQINSYRAESEQQLDRADNLKAPGELSDAQKWLQETMLLRYQALDQISKQVPKALSDRKDERSVDLIAGQMQALLASDVLYLQRFVPRAREQLEDRGLTGEVSIPTTRFLNSSDWLSPDTVRDSLLQVEGGDEVAAGVHGVGLSTVTVEPSGEELSEDSATEIALTSKLAFNVTVENQGESEETDVRVTLKIEGSNGVDLEKTIGRIAPGETASAVIPFSESVQPGPTTIEIAVEAVPGEEFKDNNQASYPVVFSR